MWIGALIFLLIMPILWAYRDPLGFPVQKSAEWHFVGFWLRALPALFIIQTPLLVSAYTFYFWIVFEFAINYFTKSDWFYTDKSTFTGALLNKLKLNGVVIFATKFALMIIFLTIYFL